MTITQIICLVVEVLLAVLCGFLIVKKSQKNTLEKWVSLITISIIAIVYTVFYTKVLAQLLVILGLSGLGGFLIIRKSQKNTLEKWVSLITISIIAIVYTIFYTKVLAQLLVVLGLGGLGGFFIIRKSEKHDLVKWVGLFILIAMALTWIFGAGAYNNGTFYDYGFNRLGLTDIPNMFYYALNFAGDKIIFLLALGCFYAVLSKTKGYKSLVNDFAKAFKRNELVFILCVSLIFVIMTTLFTQTFIPLIFVPFMVSIIVKMGLDKLTAFSTTFGSILVGTLGLTYGGEGLYWFNYYTGLTVSTGMLYRLIVLVVAYILFNIFNVLHAKKILKENNVNEKATDPFEIEEVEDRASYWPILVIFALVLIITVLGYIGWSSNFGITVFTNFHNWLMGLKLGELEIFRSILGTLSKEAVFGAWDLFHISVVLVIASILVALIGKVKLNDFISAIGEGAKKLSKPIILFIGIYMIFITATTYMSSYMPTINNLIFEGVTKFNPFLVSLSAFISNIFHADFGYTGFAIGTYFVNTYSSNVELIQLIFTTIYGFVQLCIPTSGILLIGLSYLDIKYKTWIKYIWLFIVGILVILLALFAILAYI